MTSPYSYCPSARSLAHPAMMGLSLDHMSVSEGEWQGSEWEGLSLDHMNVSKGEGQSSEEEGKEG